MEEKKTKKTKKSADEQETAAEEKKKPGRKKKEAKAEETDAPAAEIKEEKKPAKRTKKSAPAEDAEAPAQENAKEDSDSDIDRLAPILKKRSAAPDKYDMSPEARAMRRTAMRIGPDGQPIAKSKGKLKVMMLGGLGEIGKNFGVIEYEETMIIIDCGLAFPDDEMLGIDLVIPDFTYIERNYYKVKGLLLTHGHEDHIGAVPYLLKLLPGLPVYGTKLTLGILEPKLEEYKLTNQNLITVKAGDIVSLGAFKAEFIRVNHSIADACCIAVTTPVGVVLHSGDFKLDVSPIDGQMMDLTRIGEYGRKGVLLLMCESTNVERPGFTPSERKVGFSLDTIFMQNCNSRIIVATFSSNVHRVQQIINTSIKFGRKVAITGRSMINVIDAAVKLGYIDVPNGVLIDISEIDSYPKEMITIVTTGSQGEPMSSLYRMAFADHYHVTLVPGDLVVLSASPIPGNEKLISKIVNELYNNGISVYNDDTEVHVSGHACQEELKLMHALARPKFFMPIHGEHRHLVQHKNLAESMGMPSENIFVCEIGEVLELDRDSCQKTITVPAGKTLIDGSGVGDVGNVVLRDRRHLAQDGMIVVVSVVDLEQKMIVSGPDLISRGFVYVKESEELFDEAKEIAEEIISDALMESGPIDWNEMKTDVRDTLAKFLFQQTRKKPMVLPVIMTV